MLIFFCGNQIVQARFYRHTLNEYKHRKLSSSQAAIG